MSIAEIVQRKFLERKKTLALAESITGGQIAATLTARAGASQYFLGSFVVYSNGLKTGLLGIKEKTLNLMGAVSKEVALEMVEGVFAKTDADYAVSVTGIAGPSTADQPIGTVWCAVARREKPAYVVEWQLQGTRQEIIQQTTTLSLEALLNYLDKYDL